jgi:hypothetical protein
VACAACDDIGSGDIAVLDEPAFLTTVHALVERFWRRRAAGRTPFARSVRVHSYAGSAKIISHDRPLAAGVTVT